MPQHHSDINDEVKKDHFRVAIFGSARIKKDDKVYQDVFDLAKDLGSKGYDVVTGGGPGLMEAANAGHQAGDRADKADTIGLTIELPWEAKANKHLDIKEHYQRFSSRLDEFMVLSNAVVIAPGGIGTCLELFYTWQLTQVKHICPIPIILLGDMWEELYKWVKAYPVERGLVSPGDCDNVFVAHTINDAIKKIDKVYDIYQQEGADYCINYNKYKLD